MRTKRRRQKWAIVVLIMFGSLLLHHAQPTTAQTSCFRSGTIQVTDNETNTYLGLLSNVWNGLGEYVVTTDPNKGVSVSFPIKSRFSITAVNGPNTTFPYIGGIQGFSSNSPDIGPGSYNYLYLGGTVETPVDSTPQDLPNAFTAATTISRSIESAIWTISDTNALTAQWVNSDSSQPTTFGVYLNTDNIVVLTGDTAAFTNTFGPAPAVTLTFIPDAHDGWCPPVYGVDNEDDGSSQIVAIDPMTGVASPLGPRQSLDIEDVAFDSQSGALYASVGGDGTSTGAIYRVDTTTGAATLVGPSGFNDGIMVLKFRTSDHTLWGWSEGKGLVQIDPATGAGTLRYEKGMKIEGMAWAPDGKLYLVRDKKLYLYDPVTGKTKTYASNLLKGTESIDILPDGRLVGGATNKMITLFTYDLTTKDVIATKHVAQASDFTLESIEGLAWPSIATPPTDF